MNIWYICIYYMSYILHMYTPYVSHMYDLLKELANEIMKTDKSHDLLSTSQRSLSRSLKA